MMPHAQTEIGVKIVAKSKTLKRMATHLRQFDLVACLDELSEPIVPKDKREGEALAEPKVKLTNFLSADFSQC